MTTNLTRASLALALLSATSFAAQAADLPAKAPVYTKAPVLAPVFSWTGLYFGATAGVAWTTADVGLSAVNGTPPLFPAVDVPAVNALGSSRLKDTQGVFGGKIGYNQQSGATVFGLEADYSSFRFNKTFTAAGNPFSAFGGSQTHATNVSTTWLATVRGRLGFATGPALAYATGGVALGKVNFSNAFFDFSPNGAGTETATTTASQTKVGWSLGGGIDYAFTPNLILSVEYLHVDLGTLNASTVVTSSNAANATLNFSTKLRSDLLRAGIAYKL